MRQLQRDLAALKSKVQAKGLHDLTIELLDPEGEPSARFYLDGVEITEEEAYSLPSNSLKQNWEIEVDEWPKN